MTSSRATRESPPGGDGGERTWLAEVYRGGARQLTVRAALSGMLLGALMCLSNLYVVLKTGWSLGVTLTSCILAYGIFAVLRSVGLSRGDFTMLENNAMSSVASAAGYMTGGGNMAAIPALLMVTGARPGGWWMFVWFAVIAAMGVFAAIPIKRQLINVEQLAFPTGTATAETLRSLHASEGEGASKARRLGAAALAGCVVAFLRDAKVRFLPVHLPSTIGLPFSIRDQPALKWTLGFEGSLLMVGAGALMSFKTGWSMLLGAILGYGVLAPEMYSRGEIVAVGYKAIVQWTLWPAAALLLSSGLMSFALQWRSVIRAFDGITRLFRHSTVGVEDPMVRVECPAYWFPLGFAALSPVIVFLMWHLFGIPWWAGVVAIPLSLIMGVVAARVTGETDTTPTKALGPVTQLVYGAMLPGNVTANIMGANVTGGVGLHAADLLTDLKSGYLLGANPRQQLYAQLFGVVAGAAMVVPAFNLLVPTADVLGSDAMPAPGAQVWAGVSRVLARGVSGLPPTARTAALIGAIVGIALALAERWAPRRIKPFVPSAAGVGIAMVIPGWNSVSIFLGALCAELLRRFRPRMAEATVLPVSSGLVAGESLMGIVLAILSATGLTGR